MFYYINGVCLNLNDLLYFSKSSFTTEQSETQPVQQIYTINAVFKNCANALIISYYEEDLRDADFYELMAVVHGYGKPNSRE